MKSSDYDILLKAGWVSSLLPVLPFLNLVANVVL